MSTRAAATARSGVSPGRRPSSAERRLTNAAAPPSLLRSDSAWTPAASGSASEAAASTAARGAARSSSSATNRAQRATSSRGSVSSSISAITGRADIGTGSSSPTRAQSSASFRRAAFPPTEVNTVLRLTRARAATAAIGARDHPSSTKRSRAAPTTARRVARALSSRRVDRYGRRAWGTLTPSIFWGDCQCSQISSAAAEGTMRTLIVGSGPTGLLLGATLARRGHEVTSVDRDPGPLGDVWPRRGVMQFEHAHGFRPQVPMILEETWPEVFERWLSLGGRPVEVPNPVGSRTVVGMLSRRSTFERALRHEAQNQPGLTLRTGHVDGLVLDGGRVLGARVDGSLVEAELVVDASGRSGRLGGSRALGGDPDLDGDCGLAYVDRTYRLRAGAEPGPMVNPVAYI